MEVELSQLELRYAELRIVDRAQEAKLMASLASDGQLSAVAVVATAVAERFVLIDGYARVKVLRHLRRDVVQAVLLTMSEADALVMSHRLEGHRRRSALEDGWLLLRLTQDHGLKLGDLATRLGRSRSWVSRRLGLVQVLPLSVQQRVRRGQLSAQVASKYLVPLARANDAACSELSKNLAGHRPSVREMQRLYTAWRLGDAEQRSRIVAEPKLFLKATDPGEEVDDGAKRLLDDLRMLSAVSRRSERRIDEGAFAEAAEPARRRLTRAWTRTRRSFESLSATTEGWEAADAEARHA
jgi:ParB-like chromosome segregation protein Spo0J